MKRGILYTLISIFFLSYCQDNRPPLYAVKIRGVFGLVEIISASGQRRPVKKLVEDKRVQYLDELYPGDSIITGKNSRAELVLPGCYLAKYYDAEKLKPRKQAKKKTKKKKKKKKKLAKKKSKKKKSKLAKAKKKRKKKKVKQPTSCYLRMYANSLITFKTQKDRKEHSWPNFHFSYGKFLGKFDTNESRHLFYLSAKSFFMSSSRIWFSLKVKTNSDVNMAVFSGSGLVNKNYQALAESNAKLIDKSNILTNIDKYVKIGDVVSKNQRLLIKGNHVRVYNEQLNQMLKGAEIAIDYQGRGVRPQEVDQIIAKRLNLKDDDLSNIYNIKVKKIKKKDYRKKMRKRIKHLKKDFNLTKVRDVVTKKKTVNKTKSNKKKS